jgi:hypothetical protein
MNRRVSWGVTVPDPPLRFTFAPCHRRPSLAPAFCAPDGPLPSDPSLVPELVFCLCRLALSL